MATRGAPDPRKLYRSALAKHERSNIDGALADARAALALEPDYADARSYLGSTLITRRGRYAEGLAELERAKDAAPQDPTIYYTLGWCYEFVAHQASLRKRRNPVGLDPQELYRKAEAYLRRCLELNPEGKMRDDARDLLSSIIKEDVV